MQKRQKILISAFILILVLFLMVLWQSKQPRGIISAPKVGVSERLQAITIDFEVLGNPTLEALQSYPEISPFEGKIGRQNPFLSY